MTNRPVSLSRAVIRYDDGIVRKLEDQVVTEFPLTIFLDQEEFATMVCTPEYLEDMVVGFLASEGVIGSYEDIRSMEIDPDQGLAHVELHQMNSLHQKLHSKRYITSCCGKSRQSFYFVNDARTAKRITTRNVYVTYEDCFRLLEFMQESAKVFQNTGGVHNAALCTQDGVVIDRMDIGRHNALDKIYGYCLKNKVALDDKIMVFSGRISSEIVLKVAKIGCEVVLSKSAPTELALELAANLGITAVGFIRQRSLNIYTHPERIRSSMGGGHQS